MEARSRVSAQRSTGSKDAVHSSGFDSREIQQRIDEFQQTHAIPVSDINQAALLPRKIRPLAHFLQRAEHQRKRRPKFMAHIGKKERLCPIEFGKRFGAPAFLLVRLSIHDCRPDLVSGKLQKIPVLVIETQARADSHDEKPHELMRHVRADWYDHGFGRRIFPRAGR